MKLTLESTTDIYLAEELSRGGPVMVRLWTGVTDDGVPVHAYIAVVSPQTHDPEVEARFAAEFAERTVVSRGE
jgi:hypothetical protein